jgi:hypothetical protein
MLLLIYSGMQAFCPHRAVAPFAAFTRLMILSADYSTSAPSNLELIAAAAAQPDGTAAAAAASHSYPVGWYSDQHMTQFNRRRFNLLPFGVVLKFTWMLTESELFVNALVCPLNHTKVLEMTTKCTANKNYQVLRCLHINHPRIVTYGSQVGAITLMTMTSQKGRVKLRLDFVMFLCGMWHKSSLKHPTDP